MSRLPFARRHMRGTAYLTLPLVVLAVSACADSATAPPTLSGSHAQTAPRLDAAPGAPSVIRIAYLDHHAPLIKLNGVEVMNGGYGSAIVTHPSVLGDFYLLTDRGPNYAAGSNIAFALPTFTPQIARYRLDNTTLRRVGVIELKDATGHKLSGLPNPAGLGGTGEIAVDVNGNPLGTDPNGMDSEGLVATKDAFWVSEEYGPSITHFDLTGKQIERITPFSGARSLPRVFALRRPNKGMEGLTILPNTGKLLGVMQSPLDNPASAGKNSTFIRFVTFEPGTGKTKQYVYVTDSPKALISEVAALTANTFLVIERDADYPGNPASPSILKRIYKVTIGNATDVSDPANGATGKLFGGKTLEELAATDLSANSIVPLQKTLAVDLLTLGYPHDKAEGLAVIDSHTIAVSNDDDFGVTDNGSGGFIRKILPLTGKVDANDVYFIHVPQSLK